MCVERWLHGEERMWAQHVCRWKYFADVHCIFSSLVWPLPSKMHGGCSYLPLDRCTLWATWLTTFQVRHQVHNHLHCTTSMSPDSCLATADGQAASPRSARPRETAAERRRREAKEKLAQEQAIVDKVKHTARHQYVSLFICCSWLHL